MILPLLLVSLGAACVVVAPPDDSASTRGDGAVPPPEQVRDEAASGQGAVPPPEQVRDEAASGSGAILVPGAQPQPARPPNPESRPSEGVFAVGSSGIAPLPPPPPPVPPSTIARGRWSGVGWLSVRLMGTGPIAGMTPARPTVIALGGGVDGGWRVRQWFALGAGFSRQPHEISREPSFDGSTVQYRGHLSIWDVAFMRLYAPVRGRVDPYIEVGGGLAFFDPARARPTSVGGSVRGSVGLEIWVAKNLTLGLVGIYRANFIDDAIGHAWQAGLDFGIHW
jgi:hypothetical protein